MQNHSYACSLTIECAISLKKNIEFIIENDEKVEAIFGSVTR